MKFFFSLMKTIQSKINQEHEGHVPATNMRRATFVFALPPEFSPLHQFNLFGSLPRISFSLKLLHFDLIQEGIVRFGPAQPLPSSMISLRFRGSIYAVLAGKTALTFVNSTLFFNGRQRDAVKFMLRSLKKGFAYWWHAQFVFFWASSILIHATTSTTLWYWITISDVKVGGPEKISGILQPFIYFTEARGAVIVLVARSSKALHRIQRQTDWCE